jgi:tetratricopeptide (TPR) repeat protein
MTCYFALRTGWAFPADGRIAGWSAFDAGNRPAFWQSHATALDITREAGEPAAITKIVEDAGRAEILSGNHRQAAKLFELASVRRAPDAVGWGLLGSAYAGHAPDAARTALARLPDAIGADSPEALGMLGHVSLGIGDYEPAINAFTAALPHRCGRVAVQEMAPLAVAHLRLGDLGEGVRQAEKAITLASVIRSSQGSEAIERLGTELSEQRDSTAQDLARQARQLATAPA